MKSPGPGPGRRESSWPDTRLVRECLDGNEEAWAGLIEKYKNLIFSIPIKKGFTQEDAADVFQRVCLLLLAELSSLRQARALPMWLIRVTSRECFHWGRQERSHAGEESREEELAKAAASEASPEEILTEVREEQALREAMQALSPRCQRLIHMLFFEMPTRPYREAARSLGLATGSIGFIRGRCLERLRRQLESRGF